MTEQQKKVGYQSRSPLDHIGGRGRRSGPLGRVLPVVAALPFAMLALIAVPVPPVVAQTEDGSRGPASAADVEVFLDEFMPEEMERLEIPGAAVVMVRDGEVVSSLGYGFADIDKNIEVDPVETLFGIGSVTKPLTAVAALQQVERDALDLDADINTYLDFAVPDRDGSPVTLGSLLTHTSGFDERRIGYSTLDANSVEALGDFLPDHIPARFAATGEVHSYSNHNYAFAGHLVETASGQGFVGYMDDNVFGPLGMDSTAFHHALPSGLSGRLAVGYGDATSARTPSERVYDVEYPAGDVVTTPMDMASFMIAVLQDGRGNDGQIMSPETAASYLAPAYRPDADTPGRTTGGLEEMWINGEHAVGHGGDSLGGYAAQMVLLPEHDTGFFVVYNVASDEFRTTVVQALFDEFYPDQSTEPGFVELTDDELGQFAGNYRWTRFSRGTADKVVAMTPPYNTFVDANDDGTLTVSWLGVDQTWDYRPTGQATFTQVSGEPAVVNGLVLDPGERISFTVENGDVEYLHTSLHTAALERVGFLQLGIAHIVTFVVIIILFLLSLLIWPLGVLIRKRRRQEPTAGWARRLVMLETGVAALLILGTVAFFIAVSSADIAYGPTLTLYLATGLLSVGALTSLGLIPAAIAAWTGRWLTVGGRVYLTILGLTAPYLIWWTNAWNMLGFRF